MPMIFRKSGFPVLLAFYCLVSSASTSLADFYESIFHYSDAYDFPDAPVHGGDGSLFGLTTYEKTPYRRRAVVYKLSPPAGPEGKWTSERIHSFGTAKRPINSLTGVLIDPAGALYGTTLNGGAQNNGMIFRLSPPVANSKSWDLQVLHEFKDDKNGANPVSLLFGPDGALYGVTEKGGRLDGGSKKLPGNGVIFRLKQSADEARSWKYQNIFDLREPSSDEFHQLLHIDKAGNLYGITTSKRDAESHMFRLVNSGVKWRYEVIDVFDGYDEDWGVHSIVMDSDDSIIGAITRGGTGCGYIYRLKRAGSAWSRETLHQFSAPFGCAPVGLALGPQGRIWGATYRDGYISGGTIFELVKPETEEEAWRMRVAYDFRWGAAPITRPSIAGDGTLSGAAYSGDGIDVWQYEP